MEPIALTRNAQRVLLNSHGIAPAKQNALKQQETGVSQHGKVDMAGALITAAQCIMQVTVGIQSVTLLWERTRFPVSRIVGRDNLEIMVVEKL